MIGCGALGAEIREIAHRRAWTVELHSLPPLLHNRPERIAPRVERLARALQARGLPVAVAYGDCGTYGALDEVCDRLGLKRLRGLHCYDVLAGEQTMRKLFEDEPGTYVLTDFLVRSFARTVVAELGLDRHPELRDDYFARYRRVVWLAQRRTPELEAEAVSCASRLGLPLEVVEVGTGGLEAELGRLLGPAAAHDPAAGYGAAAGAPFQQPSTIKETAPRCAAS